MRSTHEIYKDDVKIKWKSNDILQSNFVPAARRGTVNPAHLNECGDLDGHPNKAKLALQESRHLGRMRGQNTEASVRDILHFPPNDARFLGAAKLCQLVTLELPSRWVPRKGSPFP